MAKTETLRLRMEPELKAEGESILSAIGLNTTDAVTMFFKQIVMQKGLPFSAKIPNAETVEALSEDLTNAKRFGSVDDLMADLDSED